jgi:hypothetical protein
MSLIFLIKLIIQILIEVKVQIQNPCEFFSCLQETISRASPGRSPASGDLGHMGGKELQWRIPGLASVAMPGSPPSPQSLFIRGFDRDLPQVPFLRPSPEGVCKDVFSTVPQYLEHFAC